ncbi:MAG: hypothetical protein Q9207_006722 [Kuettlingeria erythrocarpa]
MVSGSLFACVCLGALLLYKSSSLLRYIWLARRTGLPYAVTPFLETEVIAFLLTPILRYAYHDHLEKGQGWPRWCRFIIKDWSWEDKRIVHDELGDVFLCVSPEGIICYSADAAMGWDVMNRRNDFTKPPDKYKLLEPYGPNVATAEGADYRFHVRITAPPFGDMSGANDLVWDETLKQTKILGEAWASNVPRELDMDVNALTLAVISKAGFGKQVDWMSNTQHELSLPQGHRMSFLKAISDTTTHMLAILVAPAWLLRLTPLAKAHFAHRELDTYLRELIREESARIEANKDHQSLTARGNLLTSVMRASHNEAKGGTQQNASKGERKDGFTEDEVMGNLFIYLLAGYETTANAIAYGLIILAIRQDIQDEVIKEIDAVRAVARSEGREELSYKQDFNKLEYTYGFMYETFRLFPGVTLITKMVTKPEQIHLSPSPAADKHMPSTVTLPAGTRVYLSAPAVHYHPLYWPEPYKLDPGRWIHSSSPSSSHAAPAPSNFSAGSGKRFVTTADKDRHMRGTLLTFSDGARACLGRKFAQAEYVAFLAAILQRYRVVLGEGMRREWVERQIYLKSAGKVTLAPVAGLTVRLERR